jgi:hypothetical protein
MLPLLHDLFWFIVWSIVSFMYLTWAYYCFTAQSQHAEIIFLEPRAWSDNPVQLASQTLDSNYLTVAWFRRCEILRQLHAYDELKNHRRVIHTQLLTETCQQKIQGDVQQETNGSLFIFLTVYSTAVRIMEFRYVLRAHNSLRCISTHIWGPCSLLLGVWSWMQY